jgi:hypothetical protein
LTELVRYEAARKALAEAVAVDEVASIRNEAEALRYAARVAGDKQLEIQAAQIRFRAERRLGELIVAQKETIGLNRGRAGAGRPRLGDSDGEQPKTDERPTLAEAGIDRKLSSKAQKIAAMDAAEFEQALERHAEEMRAGAGRVAMDLHKMGAEEKGRAHRRDLAQALSAQSAALPTGRVYPAAYLDPPWKRQGGIGNRAYENHYPTMAWPEILDYLRSAAAALLPDAWAFMWIPRAHLLALVEIELEVTIAATGEVALAKVDVPLAYACQLALGMDSYSTCFVWTKTDDEHPDDSGSGLITWDQDELLLLFKRGRGLPKPEAGEKFGSNHRERAREHSRKPDFYRHMIATMVGCDSAGQPLPVLEMFARVDTEHPLPPGWDACGNQAAGSPPGEIGNATGATPSSSPARVGLRALLEGAASAPDDDTGSGDSSFAAGVPSDVGENVAAAVDATSGRASTAAAVTDNSEPAFPPTEWADLWLFLVPERDADQSERVVEIGPAYHKRGLAHEWCGQWRLTPAGEVRIKILERERNARQALYRSRLDAADFGTWLALARVAGRETVSDNEVIRDLIGRDLVGANTKRLYLTDAGAEWLGETEALVEGAAPATAAPLTPIAPKQLDLVDMLQGQG